MERQRPEVIGDLTIAKPAIGEACNFCGLCCRVRVCSTGSFALGLVAELGARADGPCPALTQTGRGFECGLILRPTDWLKSDRGVTTLREAVKTLIGSGVGCDEAGDEPDETAGPQLEAIQRRYLGRVDRRTIERAADIVFGGRR